MSRKPLTGSSSAQGHNVLPNPNPEERKRRKTRPAGRPDPDAEVVALQPEDLLATGRYMCDVCGKGFQRDQNLQLHMRTHNVNWELKKSAGTPARRKAYICPVTTCVYNDRSRALSDITGIKKHFNRKHGAKNLLCPQCSKSYAVEADLKAHIKNHSLRDYLCDCGATFSRKNSYEAHRVFCCKLVEEGAKLPSSAAVESNAVRDGDVGTYDGDFELPDMNEQVYFPDAGMASYEEAPQEEAMVVEEEQQQSTDLSALVNGNLEGPPLSDEQLRRLLAMLPDDPDCLKTLPGSLTQLLKPGYEKLIRALFGVAPASQPLQPASSSVSPLGGSSSSFMDCGAQTTVDPPGLEPSLSLSNLSAYGTGEVNSAADTENAAVNSDFMGFLPTSALSGNQSRSPSGTLFDDPMLASLANFINSPGSMPPQPGATSDSSATALLQKAGLAGATVSAPSSTCFSGPATNTGSMSSFFSPTPNHRISDPSRSAFSAYHHGKGGPSSGKPTPPPSFFRDAVQSMDSYTKQTTAAAAAVAPTGFMNFFTGPEGAPYTMQQTSHPIQGQYGAPPVAPPAMNHSREPAMNHSREEVFGNGMTMDFLGMGGEGGGHFDGQGAAVFGGNNTNNIGGYGNEGHMGCFFGGGRGDGYHRGFW